MVIIYNSLYRMLKDGSLQVMPAPVDKDTPKVLWEAARARNMAPTLARYGCGAWLWPPLTMSQSGSTFNADGYGKQYDLNVGQWPNRPIRWGTAQDIQHANTVLHEQAMMVLEDVVIHQYDGGYPSQTYTEIGENGKPDSTLFQKNPGCFVPKASADPVFDPQGNYSFGDLVSYLNSKPKGYMLDGVIRAINGDGNVSAWTECAWMIRREKTSRLRGVSRTPLVAGTLASVSVAIPVNSKAGSTNLAENEPWTSRSIGHCKQSATAAQICAHWREQVSVAGIRNTQCSL